MSDDEINTGLTIKQKGVGTFSDKDVVFTINGVDIGSAQKCWIKMDCEEVTKAHITLIDFGLDLENIPYEIKMNELIARRLLQRISHTMKTCRGILAQSQIDQIAVECDEMTKGMDTLESYKNEQKSS